MTPNSGSLYILPRIDNEFNSVGPGFLIADMTLLGKEIIIIMNPTKIKWCDATVNPIVGGAPMDAVISTPGNRLNGRSNDANYVLILSRILI